MFPNKNPDHLTFFGALDHPFLFTFGSFDIFRHFVHPFFVRWIVVLVLRTTGFRVHRSVQELPAEYGIDAVLIAHIVIARRMRDPTR